jgi:hypothetical protein
VAKFLFIYHAPTTPAETTPPSPEEVQQVMSAWMAWAGNLGDGLLDLGTPLSGGVQVTPEGTSPSTREVAGYSLIETEDMDTAVQLAKGHPHLNVPGGCTIEVHEAQPLPGM